MEEATKSEFRKLWKALSCKANCGSANYTFSNGLTNTLGQVKLGGALIQNTELSGVFDNATVDWKVGNGVTIPVFSLPVDGFVQSFQDSVKNTLSVVAIGDSSLSQIQLQHLSLNSFQNSVLQFGQGTTENNSKFILGTNSSAGASGLSWGIESWTEREEVNLFVTDNNAAHDIGRINLYCDSAITAPNFEVYVVDPTTYTGVPAHGTQRLKATVVDGIQLNYKDEDGGYVYADQSLRSNLTIKDNFVFNKPAIGDVFTITKLGYIKATIPSYLNDAAADADANLPSGGIYKLNVGRILYQKP